MRYAKKSIFSSIFEIKNLDLYFILVEPANSGNIGAAARAIKTMGFSRLRLVNPCSYQNDEALKFAHGSHDILQQAEVFESFEQSVADIGFVIGTTAKNRRVKHNFHSPRDLPKIIQSKGSTLSRVALVFGREESGLRNEELQKCDLLSSVPLIQPYPSLNLAQAVMLYAWEISALSVHVDTEAGWVQEGSFQSLKWKISSILKDWGVDESNILFPRIMERLMLIGEEDINLLHSLCKFYSAKHPESK